MSLSGSRRRRRKHRGPTSPNPDGQTGSEAWAVAERRLTEELGESVAGAVSFVDDKRVAYDLPDRIRVVRPPSIWSPRSVGGPRRANLPLRVRILLPCEFARIPTDPTLPGSGAGSGNRRPHGRAGSRSARRGVGAGSTAALDGTLQRSWPMQEGSRPGTSGWPGSRGCDRAL